MQSTGIDIEWDGEHLPKEFAKLPPGRYHVLLVDDLLELSDEEDASVQAGIDDVEAGRVRPLDDVVHEIRARINRA